MSIFTKVYPETGEFYVLTDGTKYAKTDRLATPTIKEEYAGATLCKRELNYYDDSDGYSHVWDGECVRRIGTWTTRAGTDSAGETIDVIGSPLEPAIRAWHITFLMDAFAKSRSRAYDADLRDAQRPTKGSKVKVVRGRKVPIGTQGVVFWVGPGYAKPYDRSTPPNRLGIKDAEENVYWTSETNVEVTQFNIPDPGDYPTDEEMLISLNSKTTLQLHAMYDQNTSSLAFFR